MAKFTVYFKDKPIRFSIFETGIVHIGRDETNDVAVDSLAIAPAHAAVILQNNSSIIKQLNNDFPLIINGEKYKEYPLKNGDTITIGKHHIVFNSTEKILDNKPILPEPEPESLSNALSKDGLLPDANLQVMSGKHIGRLVPLKKTMTRLGRDGSGIIIITKRKEGYYLSMLKHSDNIKINNQALAEQTRLLKNNDVILIDNIPMQFFMD